MKRLTAKNYLRGPIRQSCMTVGNHVSYQILGSRKSLCLGTGREDTLLPGEASKNMPIQKGTIPPGESKAPRPPKLCGSWLGGTK